MNKNESRAYAAHLIARQQFYWDTIAEGHPSGEILDQEDCELVADALYSCTIYFEWPDQHTIIATPEDR